MRNFNDGTIIADLLFTCKTDSDFKETIDYVYYSQNNKHLKPINFKHNF